MFRNSCNKNPANRPADPDKDRPRPRIGETCLPDSCQRILAPIRRQTLQYGIASLMIHSQIRRHPPPADIPILSGCHRCPWFLHVQHRHHDGLSVHPNLQFGTAARTDQLRFRPRRGFADPVPAPAAVSQKHITIHFSLHLFPPIHFPSYPGILSPGSHARHDSQGKQHNHQRYMRPGIGTVSHLSVASSIWPMSEAGLIAV